MEAMNRQRVAENLKRLRELHNLTLVQLSQGTGIPKGTLSYYEKYGDISDARLGVLSSYYEIPIEVLTDCWEVIQKRVPRAYIS